MKKGRFCVAPFVALNSRGEGDLRVCCSILKMDRGVMKGRTLEENNELFRDGQKYMALEREEFFNLGEDKFADVWNDTFYRDLRRKMINGEYIENCEFCYAMEDRGLSSKRIGRNKMFLGNKDGDFENVEPKQRHLQTQAAIRQARENDGACAPTPKWLEVRFSTICNLSCAMCSPGLSTTLFNEYKRNYDKLSFIQRNSLALAQKVKSEEGGLRNSEFFREQLKDLSKDIEFFEFRGGEVLRDKEMLRYIDEVSQTPNARNIRFDITSNGIGLAPGFIETLNRMGGGWFKLSIDAYGEQNEWIRYPSKWPQTLSALEVMHGLKPEWFKIVQATVGAYQAPDIDKLLVYLDDFASKRKSELYLSISRVRGFPHMVSSLVSGEARARAAVRVKEFARTSYLCSLPGPAGATNRDAVEGLIQVLLEPQEDQPKRVSELLDHVKALDNIRGTNAFALFPHLEELRRREESAWLRKPGGYLMPRLREFHARPHFCSLPFGQAVVTGDRVQPCHSFASSEKIIDPKALLNHPQISESRHAMGAGSLPVSCRRCHQREEKGQVSLRTSRSDNFLKFIEDTVHVGGQVLSLELKDGAAPIDWDALDLERNFPYLKSLKFEARDFARVEPFLRARAAAGDDPRHTRVIAAGDVTLLMPDELELLAKFDTSLVQSLDPDLLPAVLSYLAAGDSVTEAVKPFQYGIDIEEMIPVPALTEIFGVLRALKSRGIACSVFTSVIRTPSVRAIAPDVALEVERVMHDFPEFRTELGRLKSFAEENARIKEVDYGARAHNTLGV